MVLTLALDVGIINFAACLADVNGGDVDVQACVLRRIGDSKDKMEVLIRGLAAVMDAEPEVFAPRGLCRVLIEQQNGRFAPINFALSCVLYAHYARLPDVAVEFQHPRCKFNAMRASADPALDPVRERLMTAKGKDLKKLSVDVARLTATARGCAVMLAALDGNKKKDDLADVYNVVMTSGDPVCM